MNKSAVFNTELSYIKDNDLTLFVEYFLNNVVPDYFYRVAASSTGKYHPAYTLGEGGLVRHTKAAVRLAESLLSLEQYKLLPHDEIIAALILHDTFKHGIADDGNTVFTHPNIAADQVVKSAPRHLYSQAEKIANLIRSHMGQWTTNKYSVEILNKPISDAEKFVHLCDYLASRKSITVEVQP